MKTKFIIFVIAVILLIGGLGFLVNKSQGPGKLDDFAKALKSNDAVFYGAFWCPHCMEQKTLFSNSKKYLPYVECSNPDQSMNKTCTDAKVESYPTWMFKDGITITSKDNPTVCQVKPGVAGEPAICAQVSSQYYKTWLFPGYQFSIKSPTDPVKTGDVWKFEKGAQTQGVLPLEFLAQEIGYTNLPK
ncbi:MAG: hypothetical protein KGI58_00705 [Patescibacteria group bacterium]|nr:hypothetical protein [Patescibacteria group bacterium]